MISGAAKDSDPHRVSRSGELGLINRDKPKSVNLINGRGSNSRGIEFVEVGGSINGLIVNKISTFGQLSRYKQMQ